MIYVVIALLLLNLYVSVLRRKAATPGDVERIVRAESLTIRRAIGEAPEPVCTVADRQARETLAVWRERLRGAE